MGWFSDQIRARLENDDNVMDESCYRLAGAVLDKWNAVHLEDQRQICKAAIDQIVKYYHKKTVGIPDSIQDGAEQMEYVLRSAGLMIRDVELDEHWQNKAYGPMLGKIEETGEVVALMPSALFGYYYRDSSSGKKVRINRKNEGKLAKDALCFYQPLPSKKLGITDLLKYMISSITVSDWVLVVVAAAAVTAVGLIEPKVYSLVTGPLLSSRNMNLLAAMGVVLVCSAFASQTLSVVRSLLMNRISTKSSVAVESSVIMRLLSLPVRFFRQYSSGELSSRVSSVSTLCDTMLSSIFSTGLSSLLSLVYVAQIFQFAPALVVPSLLIILSIFVVSVAGSLLQIGISRKKMKLPAEENGLSTSALNGIQKIRTAGAEKRTFGRWARVYSDKAKLEYNPPTFVKIYSVITTAISLGGTVILYYVAVKTGIGESQYYAFTSAYGRVMGAFTALAGIAGTVASIRPLKEMAEPILQTEPETTEGGQTVGELTGRIEVSDVTFRYDEESPYVLKDLSLTVEAGEYVAIVGRTGCGKSTLVRLLLGFETPEAGTIFYDRYNLAAVDIRSLRKNIGVVMQNGELFSGDIYSNITISAPQLTVDEAWEAAEIAGIADDIREMPMGMSTQISEGSGSISGGQKQRLMIARAVAPKPKILILDEATSALDNKTQKQVSDSLASLNCTRIAIAHRLSTIRSCDRILVMNEGAIVEEGTYEELIAQNGFFAELVERQRLDTEE